MTSRNRQSISRSPGTATTKDDDSTRSVLLAVEKKIIPSVGLSASTMQRGRRQQTSIIVLEVRIAKITAFSSSNATLHTASAGLESSQTRRPVRRSQTLTRPSLPPLTMRVSSNCSEVTLLSWAARRWTHAFLSRLHTRTEPSDPPVTSVVPRICSWPTSEVWPCKTAKQVLKG